MKSSTLLKLLAGHRMLGLALSIPLLLWLLTGILHPIMSNTQPKPVRPMVQTSPLTTEQLLAPNALISTPSFYSLSVLQLNQQPFYRLQPSRQSDGLWLNARTGAPWAHGDQHYSEQLASEIMQRDRTHIINSQRITAFNYDYPYVNRLLPVWQVQFDDGLRVYIDAQQGRLASISNDRRLWMAKLFRLGHNWQWGVGTPSSLKTSLMAIALVGIGLLSVAGITLFVLIRNRQGQRLQHKPIRRMHRRLGVVMAFFALCWVVSGLFHVLYEHPPIVQPNYTATQHAITENGWKAVLHAAQGQTVARINWVPMGQNQWAWQLVVAKTPAATSPQEHAHHGAHHAPPPPELVYVHSQTGATIPDGAFLQATQLASDLTGHPTAHLHAHRWVTQFADEYGFVNKRLPVIQVNTHAPDGLRVYVEPSTGVIAARMNNTDALEGKVFAYLHKWSALPLPKPVRDTVLALLALLLLTTVIFGGITALWRKQ